MPPKSFAVITFFYLSSHFKITFRQNQNDFVAASNFHPLSLIFYSTCNKSVLKFSTVKPNKSDLSCFLLGIWTNIATLFKNYSLFICQSRLDINFVPFSNVISKLRLPFSKKNKTKISLGMSLWFGQKKKRPRNEFFKFTFMSSALRRRIKV